MLEEFSDLHLGCFQHFYLGFNSLKNSYSSLHIPIFLSLFSLLFPIIIQLLIKDKPLIFETRVENVLTLLLYGLKQKT